MNKKTYIKPTAVLLLFSTSESIAGEEIINTSNATIIEEGGGDLNAKECTLFNGEQDDGDEEFYLKPIHSLWDDEE